jgi:hypothetical protein
MHSPALPRTTALLCAALALALAVWIALAAPPAKAASPVWVEITVNVEGTSTMDIAAVYGACY